MERQINICAFYMWKLYDITLYINYTKTCYKLLVYISGCFAWRIKRVIIVRKFALSEFWLVCWFTLRGTVAEAIIKFHRCQPGPLAYTDFSIVFNINFHKHKINIKMFTIIKLFLPWWKMLPYDQWQIVTAESKVLLQTVDNRLHLIDQSQLLFFGKLCTKYVHTILRYHHTGSFLNFY